MNAPRISDSVRVYAELKDRLLADIPDIDEMTLSDTLEGATDLQERILAICNAALWAEAIAEAIKSRVEDLAARRKRYEDRGASLRALALWAMQEAGLPKLQAPDLTVSIGKPRASVLITDEKAVPLEFVDYTPRIRKADVKAALEAGKPVPGAALSNSPPSVTIRSK